jgi:hypothetical protein
LVNGSTKGGLGPKSLRGKRFFKGHIYIAVKASIPLKMYLKSLNFSEKGFKIFENFIKASQKAFISLEISSKSLVIFIKSLY